MSRFTRLSLVALALTASAASLAACSKDATTTSTTATSAAGTTPGTASARMAGILTGPGGMTVYSFADDTPTTVACTGSCAVAWPPVVGSTEMVTNPATSALVGSVTRPDGSSQLTYGGHPIHLFSGDTAPGETNGQGASDKWFVLDMDGNPITKS